MRAYVGLGSNLGEREATLREAVELLGEPGIDVVGVSSFRETDPVGQRRPAAVPERGAAALETSLGRELLERLLESSGALGRDRAREERWGPRTVDLDLLLYGDETVDEPGLASRTRVSPSGASCWSRSWSSIPSSSAGRARLRDLLPRS